MPTLVDLTASPYGLDDAQLAWVEQTLAGMPDEEKVGQVFVNLFHFGTDMFSGNDLTNAEILAKYHGGDSEKVQGLLNQLQADSKIPLLVAATCDAGGNGACSGGTYIASGAQCEASGDEEVAYNAGLVSAREEKALGVNLNFDPCVDILFNRRNTIVNTRAYGTNADTVIKHTDAYVRGMRAAGDVAVCIKHFPGDDTEERDQHLVLGVNELSPAEWDDSFGRVYRHHIDAGVEMIMRHHRRQSRAGHGLDQVDRGSDRQHQAGLCPDAVGDPLHREGQGDREDQTPERVAGAVGQVLDRIAPRHAEDEVDGGAEEQEHGIHDGQQDGDPGSSSSP